MVGAEITEQQEQAAEAAKREMSEAEKRKLPEAAKREMLEAEKRELPEAAKREMTEAALVVENLSKAYRQRKKPEITAVDNISFRVPRGQIFGLLGPNGAGKTTTVKMICGLIRPDGGSIRLNGIDMLKQRRRGLSQVSAVLEGNRNIYWRLTARENLEFFAALKGQAGRSDLEERILELLAFFNLTEKKEEPARRLSRGMQQKLALAVCLVADTPIVVLDEPTLGLDVKASYEIRARLQEIAGEQEKTIIITTHDMNVVEDICQEVVVIDKGRIVAADKTENLLNLFQARSYQIEIKDELSSAQREKLLGLDFLELQQNKDKVVLDLELKDASNLYRVVNILEENQTIIENIRQEQLNFEKIFMELLDNGGRK